MKKNDINLFKAAGGERAKSSKRSKFFYIVVAAIVISLIAIGVAAYFNIMLASTNSEYNEKVATLNSYVTTKNNRAVRQKAEEYQSIIANEEAAKAMDTYMESASKLFPHATESEVSVVKQAVLNQNSDYSVNDPNEEEGGIFTPWDYAQLRADLVAEDAQTDIEEKSLFYYALQVLEKAQRKNPETNIWNGYYRGYMVIVFTGGTPGYGVSELAKNFIDGSFVDGVRASMGPEGENLNVDSPFMSLDVDEYSTAKYGFVVSRDVTYNILLCPLKSVIERMFDILDAHSQDLLDAKQLSDSQKEFVSYYVESLEYSAPGIEEDGSSDKKQPSLSFKLVLPIDEEKVVDLPGFMDGFTMSPFFQVSSSTKNHGEKWDESHLVYSVELFFIGEY